MAPRSKAETKPTAQRASTRKTAAPKSAGKKRPASPENVPPAKRSRSDTKEAVNGIKPKPKPASKVPAAKPKSAPTKSTKVTSKGATKSTAKPRSTVSKDVVKPTKRVPASKTKPEAAKAARATKTQKPAKAVPAPRKVKKEEVEETIKPKAPAVNGTTKPGRPRSRRVPKESPTNPLPTPPVHTRPANQIFVWGAGNFGQFGLGPDHLGEFDKPKKNIWVENKMEEATFGPEEDAGIESVAAGGLHTMFVDEKGTIWTCGVNDDAALGRITKDVPDPENEGEFMDVDTLTSFPHPLESLVKEDFRTVSTAAGDSICAAVSDKGDLRVWGSFRSNEGSLGFSDGSKYQFIPAALPQLEALDEEKVSAVSAGNNHLAVLTTHGKVFTWGAGQQGQLGRKILERRMIHGTVPEKVTLGSRMSKAVVVGAGNYTTFAVDADGQVWGWGLNNMGQTGTGYFGEHGEPSVVLPAKVVGLSKQELGDSATVKQISGGEHHTLFLTTDGRVFACGRSNGGQLGLPDDHPAFKVPDYEGLVAEPTQVPFPDSDDPVVHISAGTHNNMAVTAAGALFSWGEGNQGELGVGDDTTAKTPRMIVRKEGGSWQAIAAACGGQHSVGLFRKKVAA